MAGGRKSAGRNYFSVFLSDDDGKEFLIRSRNDHDFIGVIVGDTQNDPIDSSIEIDAVYSKELRVMFYFGTRDFCYNSPLIFLIFYTLNIYRIQEFFARITGFFRRRRNIPRLDRYEFLNIIYEKALSDDEFKIAPTDAINLIDAYAWHRNNALSMNSYYQFILKSLVESGDLTLNSGYYKINPKAAITISTFELEDRRHKDMTRVQWILVIMTLGLVIVGLVPLFY